MAATLLLALGCEAEVLEYTEVKRIDETVSAEELHSFLRVVHALPEKRLPDWAAVFVPPPEWSPERTLPVNELAREEQAAIELPWSIDQRAAAWQQHRTLQRALRQERMTPQQFVGLALALGTAMCRSTLRGEQDLDHIIGRGEEALAWLERDRQPFAEHPPSGRHHVLRQAAWLTRAARARRLREVPAANVELVRQNWSELEPIFPAEFRTNPFDAIADPLAEHGIPFEELPESGSDERIKWTAAEVLRGTDPPDAK